MKFLPFENITYKTKLNTAEVLERLSGVIDPKRSIWMMSASGGRNNRPYEGIIDDVSFKINRILGYGNSFQPIIKGSIINDSNGSKVVVKMRLRPLVNGFIVFWFCGLGLGGLAGFSVLSGADKFETLILVLFGMLVFGYALVTGGFKFESIKSKKYLAELFEAEELLLEI